MNWLPPGFDPDLFAILIYAEIASAVTLAVLVWIGAAFLTVWLCRRLLP